ncbi:MAG: AAA family ATP:ADP antiporter [Myxococcota bacterium]|jgi:AAA family ATP:ADP antiporter
MPRRVSKHGTAFATDITEYPVSTEKTGGLRALFDVHPDERKIAALMSGYFFLVITSFWILKPIKKTFFLGFYDGSNFDVLGRTFSGSEAEQLAKVLNMVVAIGAVAAFSILAKRFRRQQLTYVFTAFFIVGYAVFAFALRSQTEIGVWSFYLFGDLFSTLMVATFFSFMNDSVSSGAAKRLYGLVGFGGVAGGAFGSTAVAAWINALPVEAWLAIAAAIGVIILVVARAAAAALPADGASPSPETTEDDSATNTPQPDVGNPVLYGARLVMQSRYLLSIVAIVGIYELVSTIVDFQFTQAIIEFSSDASERKQNFATVYATTNWLSMFVQLFLTSFVMRRFGLATALLVLPCTIALASVSFLLVPSLIVGGLLSVSDNGFSYSINQSSKEALYVPTTVEEKYFAKAFIDMFVQRFAKAIGVGLNLVVAANFKGVSGIQTLTYFVVPMLAIWAFASLNAGRQFKALEDESNSTAKDT